MSRKRKSAAQRWAGIGALTVVAVIAALLVMLVVRLVSGALNLTRSGGAGAADPQFAEPAETVTRPPEMTGEGGQFPADDDPSAEWDETELTPVDKTADELGREEAAED